MMKLLLIAGEVSADSHGAALLQEVQKEHKISVFGIGGDRLEAQGMSVTVHLKEMAFMGVAEVLRHLPFILKVKQRLLRQVKQEKPDAAILLDYPGFNLRMAHALKKMGIPVIYYISPQIWAWGRGRIKKIKRDVDLMLVLFPFEQKFYKQFGMEVQCPGHPLVDELHKFLPEKKRVYDPQKAHLGILPGSRRQEVESLLPKMVQTARRLQRQGKIKSAEILKVSNLPLTLYRQALSADDAFIHIAEKPMHQALPKYDAALVASGTATLETGYFGVPMLIVYQVNNLTYQLAKRLVKMKHVGLANIVAEKEVATELIQQAFTVQAATDEMVRILNPHTHLKKERDLAIIREKLGAPGVSQRAAKAVIDFILSKRAGTAGNINGAS